MPVRSETVMGTIVTIQVVQDAEGVQPAIDRAFEWFYEIESRCTRFNPESELMQLTNRPGVAIPVSAIVYEAVRFALLVAEETGGAFDPTIGRRMEARGFNREHRTGATVNTAISEDHDVSYRDIELDAVARTITLRRSLTLDLGAVAKGLAVDTAARELKAFRDFAIDAGGDLYLGGLNPRGQPWSVGIRHPRRDGELIESVRATDQAVCTSGDYERRVSEGGESEHHLLDPRTGRSPHEVASATVIAGGAMLADALATAAFVLGPEEGIRLLDRMEVQGLLFTPELARYETRGMCRAA